MSGRVETAFGVGSVVSLRSAPGRWRVVKIGSQKMGLLAVWVEREGPESSGPVETTLGDVSTVIEVYHPCAIPNE